MRQHALDERHALAETLRSTGPDAPTLCGEWSAAQLAAHLVLRERSLVELAGRAPVERLRRQAQARIDALVARQPYGQLVAELERGPSWADLPLGFVWALPPVREAANLLEYLVHHEDVRRAAPSWTPRTLPVDVQMAVWKRLPFAGRLTLRKVSVGLELAWPGHGSFRARGRAGAPAVRVSGEPVEVALFAFGRADVAGVEYDGEPEQIALVRGAEIGI
ncbi:MAG TPA: TIGR03085 family metal-binding protein [Jatrophihabitans sp.]|nr:TIGR03085 family metal-binding protein [Jatrophihabitans sp.]